MAAGAGYAENLRKLATFRTLEEFWGVYTHLLRADELPKDSNYHVFREGITSYPLCFPFSHTHPPLPLRLPAHVGVFSFRRLLDHSRAPPPLRLQILLHFLLCHCWRLNLRLPAWSRGFNKRFPNFDMIAALSRANALDMRFTLCYAPYKSRFTLHALLI